MNKRYPLPRETNYSPCCDCVKEGPSALYDQPATLHFSTGGTMRIWLGVFLGILLVPLVLGGAYANAASVSGRSSTVLEWYDDPDGDTAIPVYQYLQVQAKDLIKSGYNFKVYGRVADDVNDEVDIDSRLYYAYLENRELFNNLGFRLGRQFISTTAGASMMDGLSLDYAFDKNYKVRVFAGADVKYYDGYDIEDVIDGIELSGKFLDDDLEMEVSYLQKWDDGLLAKDLIGFNADYDLSKKLWLYNELQWDVLSERFSYALLGGKYRLAAPVSVRAEYLYSLPVFSSTSIYSVFAVEEYEEIMTELTWNISRKVHAFFRYTREIYEEFDDANVIEVGIEKLRQDKFSGYLVGTLRNDGDGQDLHGFKVYASYLFMPKLKTGLGANIDVLQRDIAFFNTDDADQNETTSTRLWVDAKYEFSKKVNLKGKYEYIESDLWDHYNRGTVRLNVYF